MIERKEYLDQLSAWQDDNVIKVVTGLRRCGKSTLLDQFQDLLQKEGVDPAQIHAVNFEELEHEELLDYRKLHAWIKERLVPDRMNYVFLDEIQRVASFEKVVDSLYVKDNIDLYITGSNSYMLSGDLATLLSGRYVEIKMLPFSFREYCQATGQNGPDALARYMQAGGIPYAVTMDQAETKRSQYLEGIYNTVIIKDIEERQSRKDKDLSRRKVSDIVLLKNIARFLASSIGSPVSIRSITRYLTSNGRKVSPNTVDDYVEALCSSFVFYEASRFDISGKELLQSNRKLYIVDLGLRGHILPKKTYDLGFSLENIVFFELLRRGFQVHVGKLKDMEVDFIARKNDTLLYLQVTADMTSPETFEREMKPLKQIRDNHQKMVLTLDPYTPGSYDGIQVVRLTDWLLET